MNIIQDIDEHLSIIDGALTWAKEYNKDTFPTTTLKNYRRRLKTIRAALEENCSAAAYGESQVGKSYLMSSLLSTADSPFVIENGGHTYSFINEINPSGGNNAKVEATGVITRFTIATHGSGEGVHARLLSVVDLILLIVDSYYNDIRLDPKNVLKYDEIDNSLNTKLSSCCDATYTQDILTEDDVHDICDYIRDVLGNSAASVCQSSFAKIVAPVIAQVPSEKWVEIFSLLWNENPAMSALFTALINEYRKLHFTSAVSLPFRAVVRNKGTILEIKWLDSVCGKDVVLKAGEEPTTDIYDQQGTLLVRDFSKGYLSALIAELTFELPAELATQRPFLKKMDLLDFPGARSREKYKEEKIQEVLPQILRRGKVAYLFNKYSRSLRITSVLFCHHNDQKSEPTIGDTINSWIEENVGHSPEERATLLRNTNGVAPLFFVATKFNIDLQRTRNDVASDPKTLDAHWNRFTTVIPEIIKPNKWMDEWLPAGTSGGGAFQNIFPLRDFYWSSKNELFVGYDDRTTLSREQKEYVHNDYPNYMSLLRESFLRNDFVQKHFADPAQTWNDVATLNNDGARAIIRNLDTIADYLAVAREKKYLAEVRTIRDDILHLLTVYYEPEDDAQRNDKVRTIAGDIRSELLLNVAQRPEVFGQTIDTMMIPVGMLRAIAYDIVVCHREIPQDFEPITFIRAINGIDPSAPREENIAKLCRYFSCAEEQLPAKLSAKGLTVDMIITATATVLTTTGDVVAKHIMGCWVEYLNGQTKEIQRTLPHADEVVHMLTTLAQKVGIRALVAEKVNEYCKMFDNNELPNAIADFAALTLNNFVSSVGSRYIAEGEMPAIEKKAHACAIAVDLSARAATAPHALSSLEETLRVLDAATELVKKNNVDITLLRKLPLWDNFVRWQDLLTIGLLYSSDITQCDPIANGKIKALLDSGKQLYV